MQILTDFNNFLSCCSPKRYVYKTKDLTLTPLIVRFRVKVKGQRSYFGTVPDQNVKKYNHVIYHFKALLMASLNIYWVYFNSFPFKSYSKNSFKILPMADMAEIEFFIFL